MNINGKRFEFSEIDDTYISHKGRRWSAYDMVTYLRVALLDWGDVEKPPLLMVNDVLNMDIIEDYDADNFDVVSIETLKEEDFPVESSSFDDDGLL
tara:strand:+ start:130 stop:417 length:288 start_codon:yes stop_codon:yes gene_type:complete